MNEINSVLIATTFLALGGLGLYMYKSSDKKSKKYDGDCDDYDDFSSDDSYIESDDDQTDEKDSDKKTDNKGFFDNFWGSEEKDYDFIDDEDEEIKPRKGNTKKAKTQKKRKSTNSSKRKY